MKKRLVGLTIAAILLICSFTVSLAAGEDIVVFADANLKQALIDIGADTDPTPDGDMEISEDEMAALSGDLDLGGKEIGDLGGMEFATGITGLDVSNNDLSDIGILVEMAQVEGSTLTTLNVTMNYLDISDGSDDMLDIEALLLAGCTVIYSPQKSIAVQGVTLDSEATLCVGDTVELTMTIVPDDATNQNVTWSSSDTGVATVSDGVVTAVALGSANITVTTQDGGYAAQCAISVVSSKISSDLYTIWEDKLWFASEKTSAAGLCDNMTNDNKYLTVHNPDGSEYTGDAVGTRMSVRLTVGGEVKDEVTILTRGDSNGDGVVSITDYTMMRLHILDLNIMNEPDWFAVDLSGDALITITDYTMLRVHILELILISDSYSPIDPGESVDPTNPNDPGYLATISNPRIRYFLEIALAQQEKPYVGGEEGPDSYDCSGLVYYCLQEAGYSPIWRSTARGYADFDRDQDDPTTWRWPWIYITAEDMQPGDLMFYESDPYDPNRPIGHVGIYLGNGYHIHASSTNEQVIISKFTNWYDRQFRYARRVNW